MHSDAHREYALRCSAPSSAAQQKTAKRPLSWNSRRWKAPSPKSRRNAASAARSTASYSSPPAAAAGSAAGVSSSSYSSSYGSLRPSESSGPTSNAKTGSSTAPAAHEKNEGALERNEIGKYTPSADSNPTTRSAATENAAPITAFVSPPGVAAAYCSRRDAPPWRSDRIIEAGVGGGGMIEALSGRRRRRSGIDRGRLRGRTSSDAPSKTT
ncbi:hypothetical protein M885DRAFT_508179 [Pelagophyceae sp. CCMP2097]|nr:hypothetical protein M885DRAFT_508179 [Pelagophyceae sp. CCMP2097]|mmetsp:Transcript_754/g.2795  ORF Transcript_754/g.2795 Transcript_754/m.2795 type:complete len:212 (-) Transcript_754:183-818(-)